LSFNLKKLILSILLFLLSISLDVVLEKVTCKKKEKQMKNNLKEGNLFEVK